jgi:DNA-binding response OmpR family regulator
MNESAPIDEIVAGKTILIAEDDPFILRMYQIKLEGAGFTVVVKTNGRDAYEYIKESRPDLFITSS